MIYGIGIDLVRIERMKDVVDKWGKKFIQRVFTKDEISYCYEKEPLSFSRSPFCGKEALIKAIGSEVVVPLTDIEVISSENGKPVIKVNGKLKRFFEEKAIKQASISLSHEKDYGIACVVLEI